VKLIERYLHEVGRYLPRNKRADILSELRSVLEDSLEAAAGPEPKEADAAEVIRNMGEPRKVAAGYNPANQYLIGPELFPFFRMVLGIVLLASIGGQLIAVLVATLFGDSQLQFLELIFNIVNSLPVTIGMVVVVFYILQRYEINPGLKEESFDPYKLPDFDTEEKVNTVEQVVSIILGVFFFIVLAWAANEGAFGWTSTNGVVNNPVLEQNFIWLGLSIIAGVILSIVLLWRGRWSVSTRVANIMVNLFSLGVLYHLIERHRAWLLAAGYSRNFNVIAELPEMVEAGGQAAVMLGTQFGLMVAAIVILVETIVLLVRLFLNLIRGNKVPVIELSSR
jgi:hypothetical protein